MASGPTTVIAEAAETMNATRDHSFEIVDAETLECELNQVRAAAAGSLAGIFRPRSMIWRVDREAAIFLGAGRALLLQLCRASRVRGFRILTPQRSLAATRTPQTILF
jgi:hypothetical protein